MLESLNIYVIKVAIEGPSCCESDDDDDESDESDDEEDEDEDDKKGEVPENFTIDQIFEFVDLGDVNELKKVPLEQLLMKGNDGDTVLHR
jgi:hypothetical protein